MTYFTTGISAVIETGMIWFLIIFLGWNIKLFLEKSSDEK